MRWVLLFIFIFSSWGLWALPDATDFLKDTTEKKIKKKEQEISFDLGSKEKIKYKSPWLAAMFSIVPGGGQFYVDKKRFWWKVVGYPIGIFFLGVAVDFNQQRYENFRFAYNQYDYATKNNLDLIEFSKKVDPQVQPYFEYKLGDQLQKARDFYLSQRDMWITLTIVGWTINILDAVVYAHLSGFDLGKKKKTTLFIRPKVPDPIELLAGSNYGGLSVSLKF